MAHCLANAEGILEEIPADANNTVPLQEDMTTVEPIFADASLIQDELDFELPGRPLTIIQHE